MSNLSQISYLENQLEVTRRELKNLRQQLKSLQFIHQKECAKVKKYLESFQCPSCKHGQNTQKSVAQSAPHVTDNKAVVMKQIGIINTDFPEKRGTPRQAIICSSAVAKLTLNNEVFTNPSHSLQGLQEFSHMWILFHFHKVDATHVKAKITPPRLNGIKTGIFGTRSPHRPSPIGLSLVKINEIRGATIHFSGVDMIDGTPVIDIKPYIPHYDNPQMISMLRFNMSSRSLSSQDETDSQVDVEEESERDFLIRDESVEQLVHNPARNELHYSQLGEREAPDGEEEESDLNVTGNPNTNLAEIIDIESPEEQIRVPSWIHDAPVATLDVRFEERALLQLSQLGPEGEIKKNIITSVLREDPRTIYFRERWRNQKYIFKISDLHVSCKFNDIEHIVSVNQVFEGDD